MYGLTSQMRRAAYGTASDIAEGQGRLTYGEWRRLLSDARGSLYELQAQMIIAQRLGFLTEPAAAHLQKLADTTGRELAGLITWVKRRDAEAKRKLRVRPQTTSNEQPTTCARTR